MHYGCRVVGMQLIVAAMHYGVSAAMHCKKMENNKVTTSKYFSFGKFFEHGHQNKFEWRETLLLWWYNETSDTQLKAHHILMDHLLFGPAEPWITMGFEITTILSFRIDWLSPTSPISGGSRNYKLFFFILFIVLLLYISFLIFDFICIADIS